MNQRTKFILSTTGLIAGTLALVAGFSLSDVRERSRQEAREQELTRWENGLRAVDTYIDAMQNPARYEFNYMMGWNPKIGIPEKYEEFIQQYEESFKHHQLSELSK